MTQTDTQADIFENALAQWHEIVAERDMAKLSALTHANAALRSPSGITPYMGSAAVVLALSTVIEIFDDFTYHREFRDPAANSVALEFSAKIDDLDLKGVDLIRFDETGKLIELEVMIRPLSALKRLEQRMGEAVGAMIAKAKKTSS